MRKTYCHCRQYSCVQSTSHQRPMPLLTHRLSFSHSVIVAQQTTSKQICLLSHKKHTKHLKLCHISLYLENDIFNQWFSL